MSIRLRSYAFALLMALGLSSTAGAQVAQPTGCPAPYTGNVCLGSGGSDLDVIVVAGVPAMVFNRAAKTMTLVNGWAPVSWPLGPTVFTGTGTTYAGTFQAADYYQLQLKSTGTNGHNDLEFISGTNAAVQIFTSGDTIAASAFDLYVGGDARLHYANATSSTGQFRISGGGASSSFVDDTTSGAVAVTVGRPSSASTPAPTRLRTNMAAADSGGVALANGDWWVESNTGAATGSYGLLKTRLNGATTTLASGLGTTAPTVASGGCTSPAIAANDGSRAFSVTIGSSCSGVKTITLTFPTAPTGWACDAQDVTTPASFVIAMASPSTTAVTFNNYSRTTGLAIDFVAAESLYVNCKGF